jgi:hypothetical protein
VDWEVGASFGSGLQNGGCLRNGREDGGNLLYITSNKWSFGFETTLLPLDLMISFGVYDTIYICFLK